MPSTRQPPPTKASRAGKSAASAQKRVRGTAATSTKKRKGEGAKRASVRGVVCKVCPKSTQSEAEKVFLRELEELNGSASFKKKVVCGRNIPWYKLYLKVKDMRGYDEVKALPKGKGFCVIARELLGPKIDHRAGHELSRAYLEFLLRYESEQAFDRDVQILDAKEDLLRSAEDDEGLDTEVAVRLPGEDINYKVKAEGVILHVRNLVNKVLQSMVPGKASEGCSLGRHALQGLDERLRQLLSLGQERGDVKNILIYGRNGVGKSTLIQSILRLGEAPQWMYAELQEHDGGLEAGQYLRAQYGYSSDQEKDEEDGYDSDGEDRQKYDLPRTCKLQHLTADFLDVDLDELRRIDDESTERIRKYCEGTGDRAQGLEPFLLPTGNARTSTTSSCTILRYGRCYQLLLIYENEAEIRRQLEGFNWEQAAKLGRMDDEKAKMGYEYVKRLYAVVTGHVRHEDEARSNVGEPSSAGQRNRVEQRRVETEDDDDEEEEGWLSATIAAVRGRAAKQKPVPYPTKNLAEGELIVAADIQKVLGKSFAFIGPGDSVQDDRLLIKEAIKKTVKDPRAILLKDIVAFAPCSLLEGDVELVDSPGAEDSDPIKYRNLCEALDRADHVVVMLEKDLDSAWGTTSTLVKQDVFRRLETKAIGDGYKPVQLSVLLVSEKDERPTGKHMIDDEWASAYRAAVQEVMPKVEAKLNQLREDAYRAAEVEVPASFAADVSNIKILVAFPLLYTSIILNDKYRAQHAVDFGDMLERSGGSAIMSLINDAGAAITAERCRDIKDFCHVKMKDMAELEAIPYERLPEEIIRAAMNGWTFAGRKEAAKALWDAVQDSEGFARMRGLGTGNVAKGFEEAWAHLMKVFEAGLVRAFSALKARLEQIREDKSKLPDDGLLYQMARIFTPYARGRDGDMSWIKLAMGAFMTKDIVEAGKPLCDEIEETVTTFQDKAWEACRQVWLDRLDPWRQATVAEAAKKRDDRRARQSTDDATGATTAKRAAPSSVEQPETALQRRLRFFGMLRFKDELSLICQGLPTLRRFEGHKGMRAFIQDQVQQCLLDEVPKFTHRVKKPDDVIPAMQDRFEWLKKNLEKYFKHAFKMEWEARWRKVGKRVSTDYQGLKVLHKDLVTGIIGHRVSQTKPRELVMKAFARCTASIEKLEGAALSNARFLDLCDRLLDRRSTYPEPVCSLLQQASNYVLKPIKGVTLMPNELEPLAAALGSAGALSKGSKLPSKFKPGQGDSCSVSGLCRALVHVAGGLWAKDYPAIIADLPTVLAGHICGKLLSAKRKARFAKTRGGQETIDAVLELVQGRSLPAGHASFGWVCVVLLEAFARKAGVAVDVYVVTEGGAERRWRVVPPADKRLEEPSEMEGGRGEEVGLALEVAFAKHGWLLPKLGESARKLEARRKSAVGGRSAVAEEDDEEEEEAADASDSSESASEAEEDDAEGESEKDEEGGMAPRKGAKRPMTQRHGKGKAESAGMNDSEDSADFDDIILDEEDRDGAAASSRKRGHKAVARAAMGEEEGEEELCVQGGGGVEGQTGGKAKRRKK